MVRNLLIRGMLVGLVAGLLGFVFARAFGEPSLAAAIGYEDAAAHAAGAHEHEEPLVSRSTQSGIGLATAIGVYGIAIGGLFALAFAAVHGRLGDLGPRATAAVLGLAAFLGIYLLPFLKYPAMPPAASRDDTIDERTSLYLIAVVLSVLTVVGAVYLGRRLAARLGHWNGGLLAGAAFLAVTVAVHFALPTIDEIPGDFPATVLWEFRVSAVGIQLLLWTVLGLGFGPLAEKVLDARRRPVVAAT